MRFVQLTFWVAMGSLSFFALIGVGLGALLLSLPSVHELDGCLTTTMYHVRLCSAGDHYVKLKDISPEVTLAVVSSEDTAFYSHHGFDWYEIEQSLKTNLAENHIHRGASTLTQQLAKNVWLTKERSYWRKLKEAYLTYELEKNYSKKFILEKYLNVVQFGPDLYGVKDAAAFYFKKSPSQLHLLEATFLAFVLPNPDVYWKSYRNGHLTAFAQKIIEIVLKRMVQFKEITPDAYQFAISQLPSFPWAGLTQADFDNARMGGTGAIEESEQDMKDIDQFLNSEPAAGDTTDGAPIPDGETN